MCEAERADTRRHNSSCASFCTQASLKFLRSQYDRTLWQATKDDTAHALCGVYCQGHVPTSRAHCSQRYTEHELFFSFVPSVAGTFKDRHHRRTGLAFELITFNRFLPIPLSFSKHADPPESCNRAIQNDTRKHFERCYSLL